MNIQSLVSVLALFMFIIGSVGQATTAMAYSTPPSWMPMTMLDISFNAGTNKLAIAPTTFAAPLSTNTNMMGAPAAGVASFDPSTPYAVLNGTAFSRRFGWNDANEMTSSAILPAVQAFYGQGANIWIQSLSQSPGFSTYQAIGANGLDMGNTYPGIFGTAGSSTKWKWDGMMDHNTNAVPFSFLTKPNQFFSAYYKIYVGDAVGNELLVDKNGIKVASAATDTTWGWQGPPFVFTSQTGVAVSTLLESDVYTHTDDASPITVTGGEYAISTDGGSSWADWTSAAGTINKNDKVKVRQTSSAIAGTTTTATLAIPTANGSGQFRVTTAGTNPSDTVPNTFTFTSLTIAPANTVTESSVVTISGINAPSAISVSGGGQYAISTDNGLSWGAWTSIAGTVENSNQVKVHLTSSATPGASASTILTIGGVTATFSVTTGSPVPPSTTFTSVSNAPANTSVSGMPFYVMSNPIAATADSSISVAGGITPQYSVSTDGGYNWSVWSSTTPATVVAGTHVKVRVVPATTPFTTSTTNLNLGSTIIGFSVTTGYVNPPSWMPMAMLNVTFNSSTNTLSVQDESTHPSFSSGALPALTYVPAGSYDPSKPWSVLNGGVAISRQLGWDDSSALHGSGITIPGSILYQIQAAFPGASIWIERLSQSPGLETYYADGMFGVGGTSSGALTGSPQPYSNMMTGFANIYENNYYGIFGTAGSSTKWKWDGTMIHNVYAVPAAYITQPNQLFTATYKVYVGDSAGNEVAGSTSTTETWTWKGPASAFIFGFASQTDAATSTSVESNTITVANITTPAAISISGGAFAVSTDSGATWSAYSASPATVSAGDQVKVRQTTSAMPGATSNATLTIGTIPGAFSVTTVKRNGSTGVKPTVSDALKALQLYSGAIPLTPVDQIRYDVAPLAANGIPQGNGAVDVADVIMLLRRSIDIGTW
ncbi:MAG: hypothetical protein PHI31_03495 [Desulfuromonadaceae bacterium]|nr:hypothetical protein [Desulfuromonadaceae bacterium]